MSVDDVVQAVQSKKWRDPPAQPVLRRDHNRRTLLAAVFKAIKIAGYVLSYLVAAAVAFVLVTVTVAFIAAAVHGDWLSAVAKVPAMIFWGFILLCMAENTQRHIEERFGTLWDWRRGRLREPRRVSIQP